MNSDDEINEEWLKQQILATLEEVLEMTRNIQIAIDKKSGKANPKPALNEQFVSMAVKACMARSQAKNGRKNPA